MKKVSKKQSILNRAVAKIKASKADRCMICGRPYTDAAHLLPRSLYPEYYTEEWNIVPLCREHHTEVDHIGDEALCEIYHVSPVLIDARIAKTYRLRSKEGRVNDGA